MQLKITSFVNEHLYTNKLFIFHYLIHIIYKDNI